MADKYLTPLQIDKRVKEIENRWDDPRHYGSDVHDALVIIRQLRAELAERQRQVGEIAVPLEASRGLWESLAAQRKEEG